MRVGRALSKGCSGSSHRRHGSTGVGDSICVVRVQPCVFSLSLELEISLSPLARSQLPASFDPLILLQSPIHIGSSVPIRREPILPKTIENRPNLNKVCFSSPI
ncbi:hypothetical protein YC2023_032195 [Brassica napus]